MTDENINPDEELDADPSAADTKPDEDISEDDKTPSDQGSVPYYRFKEINDERKQFKETIETLKEDIETLKTSLPREEEPEPTTWAEMEERAVKKALEAVQKENLTERQKEMEEERKIEKGFEQLKAIGQEITPEIKKAILTKMIETGSDDLFDTYLEVKKKSLKTEKTEQQKIEGQTPSSKGGEGKTSFQYQSIKGKSPIDILREEGGM